MPEPGPNNNPTLDPGQEGSGERIAILLPDLSGGGAERVMLDLARGFLDRGYPCDLVLYRKSGSYLDQIPAGLEVVDLEAARSVRAILPLARYLRRVAPAALVSSLPHTNVIASWAVHLGRIDLRLILTVHNMTSVELAGHYRPGLARITPWLMNLSYGRADKVVTVSQGVARDLESITTIPPGLIQTIYNPCDLDKVRKGAAQGLDHPWFKEGQPPLILALGRLLEQKDFPTLIRAVAELHRSRPVRLMILGQGPDLEDLTGLAENLGLGDDFSFPGFIKNPYPFVDQADLVGLSSIHEGFGLVLVEALALGTPVVSTDCPYGPAEILDNGRFGRLVPVGDHQALAQAMARTLDDPPSADSLISRAQDFSTDKAVEKYLALIENRPSHGSAPPGSPKPREEKP